jgi:hypothetical protein
MIRPLLIERLQSSRWDEAIFLMIPGISCLATIVLSLRDKNIRPSNYFSAEWLKDANSNKK